MAIPKTRNFGVLPLCPVIVNTLCFHSCLTGGSLGDPLVISVTVLAAYLLWNGRRKFLGLLR